MKVYTSLRTGDDLDGLRYSLVQEWPRLTGAINALAEGRISGVNGFSSVPTGGPWAIGDFVRNSAPVEAGTTPNKYVVLGWSRITNGTGNVLNTDWLECRALTGN